MIGKLVWKQSGDEISFSASSPDLLAYYVETLNATNANDFSLAHSEFEFENVDKLIQSISNVSQVANKIPFEISNWEGDVFDQTYLNTLHQQWVSTGLKYPMITTLLRKLKNLDVDYRNINSFIHALERSFRYNFKNYVCDPYQVDNIFGSSILSFDTPNISIGFDNLGRSSWNKFYNFDYNDQDTNDYKKLSGLVHVNLNQPVTGYPPPEYVQWCSNKGVPVIGRTLSLGNIVDLEKKLTDLRKIIVRNVNEQNDRFFFEICS